MRFLLGNEGKFEYDGLVGSASRDRDIYKSFTYGISKEEESV